MMRQIDRKKMDMDETYRHIVYGLIEQYNWKLVTKDELVTLVLTSIEGETTPEVYKRVAMNHYTPILYQACHQTADPARRNQGYQELYRYLYRAAYNCCSDVAEDATQQALILVHEQIDRCHNPRTFLAFALYKLRHACQQERRVRGKELAMTNVESAEGSEEQATLTSDLSHKERLTFLVERLNKLLPRREQEIIVGKYLEGVSDEEMSTRLGVTPGHIRVLRHRALKRLRDDALLRDYFWLK